MDRGVEIVHLIVDKWRVNLSALHQHELIEIIDAMMKQSYEIGKRDQLKELEEALRRKNEV